VNYAIEPTRSRRQGRVDGLKTPRHRADAATGTRRVDGVISTQVWDIEKGSESASCEEHKQLIQDIVWDHEGKVWATSSKDKKLRLGDPRSKSIVGEIDQAHAGAKSTKLSFLGGFDRLCSVGFTKQSQRQIKFWDVKKLGGEPVHQIQLDQASGVIIPYYDVDTRVLYLAGKGDGNIRYYENIAEKPWAFALSEYRSTQAAKGTCFVPKRGLDVMRCETARCLKLVSQAGKGSVEPLSFIVPRKSDAFQDDIFPDAFCGAPSMTADEWSAAAHESNRRGASRFGSLIDRCSQRGHAIAEKGLCEESSGAPNSLVDLRAGGRVRTRNRGPRPWTPPRRATAPRPSPRRSRR